MFYMNTFFLKPDPHHCCNDWDVKAGRLYNNVPERIALFFQAQSTRLSNNGAWSVQMQTVAGSCVFICLLFKALQYSNNAFVLV